MQHTPYTLEHPSQLLLEYKAPGACTPCSETKGLPPFLLDVSLIWTGMKSLLTTATSENVLSKPLNAGQPMAPLGTGNAIWVS